MGTLEIFAALLIYEDIPLADSASGSGRGSRLQKQKGSGSGALPKIILKTGKTCIPDGSGGRLAPPNVIASWGYQKRPSIDLPKNTRKSAGTGQGPPWKLGRNLPSHPHAQSQGVSSKKGPA